MKEDALITFIPNDNPASPIIPANSPVFSIPYSVILKAQRFCRDEELDYCFVGFKGQDWNISGIPTGLNPVIQVTETGIHTDTSIRYIHCLTKDS